MVEKLQLPIAIEMDIKSKCVHIKDITVYQASNDTDTIRCTAVSYRRSQFTIYNFIRFASYLPFDSHFTSIQSIYRFQMVKNGITSTCMTIDTQWQCQH